jgi:hypothetical protein
LPVPLPALPPLPVVEPPDPVPVPVPVDPAAPAVPEPPVPELDPPLPIVPPDPPVQAISVSARPHANPTPSHRTVCDLAFILTSTHE